MKKKINQNKKQSIGKNKKNKKPLSQTYKIKLDNSVYRLVSKRNLRALDV